MHSNHLGFSKEFEERENGLESNLNALLQSNHWKKEDPTVIEDIEDHDYYYVGSVSCFGVAEQCFSTGGRQRELKVIKATHTGLTLMYDKNDIFLPLIFSQQLFEFESKRNLGRLRYFCKTGQFEKKVNDKKKEKSVKKKLKSKPKSKSKEEEEEGNFQRAEQQTLTASKKFVLKRRGLKKVEKVTNIRIDIYINEKIFNEMTPTYSNYIRQLSLLKSISNVGLSKEEKESRRQSLNELENMIEEEQVPRSLLLYLMEKSQAKVINRSFVKPPAKMNILMRKFRQQTIGLITRNKRNERRVMDKIRRWKKEFQYLSIVYPCVREKESFDYYQALPPETMVWNEKQSDFYQRLQDLEIAKLVHKGNFNEGHPSDEIISQNLKKILSEIGGQAFDQDHSQPVESDDEEEDESLTVGKMDLDEKALMKKNNSLMERFETENKYFKHHKNPPNMISQLKPYQQQALQWMKYREGQIGVEDLFQDQYMEQSDEFEFERKLSPFWEEVELRNKEKFYVNYLTGEFTKVFHAWKSIRGGILADEMGLGKTVMTLSLLADEEWVGLNLIVVPVAVLIQWREEIRKHCGESILVFEYHSESSKRKKIDLTKYQIVIVTYATLGLQFRNYSRNQQKSKDEKFIFDYEFQRVILDEAHNIKSTDTNQFKAVMQLKAQFSWCLTGTLIQNSVQDLFAIFKFLKVQVFCEQTWWNRYIKNASCSQSQLNVIQTVLRPIVLRRTKKSTGQGGESIIDLVKRKEIFVRPEFTGDERRIYEKLRAGMKQYFLKNQSDLANYTHIFQILTKLRQFCCHAALVFGSNIENIGEIEVDTILGQFLSGKVQDKYKKEAIFTLTEGEENCPICLDPPKDQDAGMTECGHFFCEPCFKMQLLRSSFCPSCRAPISAKTFIKKIDVIPVQDVKSLSQSTKLASIMKVLEQIEKRGEKCVIFTQWTKVIELLEQKLLEKGIQFGVIVGKMSPEHRQRTVRRFKEKNKCIYLIVSIRAGGTGLNLANANNVIICDPWWNPAQEDQAIGRVHRIGQEKEVNVYRIVIKDSIQERIHAMHGKKRLLADQIMMEKGSLDAKKSGVEELLELLD